MGKIILRGLCCHQVLISQSDERHKACSRGRIFYLRHACFLMFSTTASHTVRKRKVPSPCPKPVTASYVLNKEERCNDLFTKTNLCNTESNSDMKQFRAPKLDDWKRASLEQQKLKKHLLEKELRPIDQLLVNARAFLCKPFST